MTPTDRQVREGLEDAGLYPAFCPQSITSAGLALVASPVFFSKSPENRLDRISTRKSRMYSAPRA